MSAVPPDLVIGCRVKVPTKNLEGIVHFVGATKFASGKWVGIELGVCPSPARPRPDTITNSTGGSAGALPLSCGSLLTVWRSNRTQCAGALTRWSSALRMYSMPCQGGGGVNSMEFHRCKVRGIGGGILSVCLF